MRAIAVAFVAVIVLSLFLIQPIQAQGNTHFAQDPTGNTGIGAFGPFVAGFYEVVRGQNLSSSLAVKNTGKVVEDIKINTTILGDPSKISYSISEHEFEIFPDEIRMIDVSVLILSNQSDYVTIQLDIRAFGRDLRNDTNILECGIRVSSVFHIAGEGFLLVVHIVDQHGNPYADGLEIEVLRDVIVSYGRHYPDWNATYYTMLAKGNYTVRIWRGEEIAKSVDFELTKDVVLTIRIDRPSEPSGFGTIHLLEIVIGLALGYFLRIGEIRYREKRRVRKSKINLGPEEKALWDWATREID